MWNHDREAELTAEYRVQLDVFSGPLDLCLIRPPRRADIQDIQIARIADQYSPMSLMEQLDPNAAAIS